MPRTSDARERLIETASRIFGSRGYSGSGVLEIQREAKVSTGSFYHFFSSKEELLLAVLESALDTAREILVDVETTDSEALDRIHMLFELHHRILREEEFQRTSPLCMLGADLGQCSSKVRERLLQLRELYVNTMESWLETLRFPSGIRAHSFAILIYSALEGAFLQSHLTEDSEPFEASVSQLERMLEVALEPSTDRPEGTRTPVDETPELFEADKAAWKTW